MSEKDRSRRLFGRLSLLGSLTLLLIVHAATIGAAADPAADPEALKFFETKIRPALAQNCFKCHGPVKQKGGLRLDSREAVIKGGESGPAVVPGNRDESLLVEAIHFAGLEMPPTGKLDEGTLQALTRWVEMGAPWPQNDVTSAAAATTTPAPDQPRISEEDRKHWSFQPLRRPSVPLEQARGDRSERSEIDAFIEERCRRST